MATLRSIFISRGYYKIEIWKNGYYVKSAETQPNGLLRVRLASGTYDFICPKKLEISIYNKVIGNKKTRPREFGVVYHDSGSS